MVFVVLTLKVSAPYVHCEKVAVGIAIGSRMLPYFRNDACRCALDLIYVSQVVPHKALDPMNVVWEVKLGEMGSIHWT